MYKPHIHKLLSHQSCKSPTSSSLTTHSSKSEFIKRLDHNPNTQIPPETKDKPESTKIIQAPLEKPKVLELLLSKYNIPYDPQKIQDTSQLILYKLAISATTTIMGYPSVQNMILKEPTTLKRSILNYLDIVYNTPLKGFSKYGKGAGAATTIQIFVGLTTLEPIENHLEQLYPNTDPEKRKRQALLISSLISAFASVIPVVIARNNRIAYEHNINKIKIHQKIAGLIPALIRDTFMSIMQLSTHLSEKLIFGLLTTPPNTYSQNIANNKILNQRNPFRDLPKKLKDAWNQNYSTSRLPIKSKYISEKNIEKSINYLKKISVVTQIFGKTFFGGFWARVIHLSVVCITLSTLRSLHLNFQPFPSQIDPSHPTKPVMDHLQNQNETLEDFFEKGGHLQLESIFTPSTLTTPHPQLQKYHTSLLTPSLTEDLRKNNETLEDFIEAGGYPFLTQSHLKAPTTTTPKQPTFFEKLRENNQTLEDHIESGGFRL